MSGHGILWLQFNQEGKENRQDMEVLLDVMKQLIKMSF